MSGEVRRACFMGVDANGSCELNIHGEHGLSQPPTVSKLKRHRLEGGGFLQALRRPGVELMEVAIIEVKPGLCLPLKAETSLSWNTSTISHLRLSHRRSIASRWRCGEVVPSTSLDSRS